MLNEKNVISYFFFLAVFTGCNAELGKLPMDTVSDMVFLSCLAGQTARCETNLSVVSILPEDGAVNISSLPNIKVVFNQPIISDSITVQNAAGVCSGSIQISKDNFSTCHGLTQNQSSATEYSFKPSGALTLNSYYKVKVSAGIKATGGKSLLLDFIQKNGFHISLDTTAPTFAGATSATPNGGTFVTINWNSATDDVSISGNLTYDICVSTTSGTCQSTFTVHSTSPAGATSFSVSSLTPNTVYYFIVRAKDEAGNRDTNTIQVSATTPVENIYTNVALTSIQAEGWTICMQEDYGATLNLTSIFASCTQANLMLACRPTGDPNVTLAAYGATSDVTFDTTTDQTTVHSAGGVNWYYNSSQSWGFALGGELVNKNTCDVESSFPEKRLCWHSNSSGWRCGAATGIYSGYDRLILQKN